jgi:predicted transcriptional regulator of viral defense system
MRHRNLEIFLPIIHQKRHFMVYSMNERQTMGAIANYIQGLLQRGRHHFTTEEAIAALGGDRSAVSRALLRLKNKGDLATPLRGFYVVVPPEYRSLGCLPAEQFVHQLMEHLGTPYHVALLSAAELHGAAHQRPQRFQVMVDRRRASIECGSVAVDFHVRNDLDRVSTLAVNTPRGHLRVSSPEATAVELVGYAKHAGGLDNVATVLSELAESISPEKLLEEARKAPLAWAQRLGFLLDLVGRSDVAEDLLPFVQVRARRVVPLEASSPRTGAKRSARWRVAINVDVEPDL